MRREDIIGGEHRVFFARGNIWKRQQVLDVERLRNARRSLADILNKPTIAESEEKLVAIGQEMERWEKEKEAIEALEEARELMDEWYEERITLDDALREMMKRGLCNKLSPWPKNKD